MDILNIGRLKYFPHFIRKIHASICYNFNLILISVFVGIIALNMYYEYRTNSSDAYENLRKNIFLYPSGSIQHLKMAEYLLSLNAKAAEREYLLADEDQKNETD